MEVKNVNLCFDEQPFYKENFSVDEFLTKHRRIANLETLRDDLGIFLKNLRSSTIELINKDYADFVALAANLYTLEEKVVIVDEPLMKIRDEVMKAKTQLDGKINKIEGLIERRSQIRKRMQSIQSTTRIQSCLHKLSEAVKNTYENDLDDSVKQLKLERALNEINQYYYHSKQIQNLDPIYVKKFEGLFDVFLSHLKDFFLLSIKTERNFLVDCLRLFVSINKVSLAHDIVKEEIITPIMAQLVSEEALHNEPGGLEGLYSKIISSIDRELRYLLDVTQIPSNKIHVKGFDFMVYSVWPELENRLEFHLKSIYSPAHPDTFFKCYNQTFAFLDRFEQYCTTPESVHNFRKLQSYKDFMNCWNLQVYYTLRFQEFGGQLEKVMHSLKYTTTDISTEWQLKVSEEAWNCITRCWHKDIFIRQLSHRFWKFNLQIIARYQVWIQSMLDTKNSSQLPIPKLNYLIFIYSDGYHLIEKFATIFEMAKNRIGNPISETILQNMQACLKGSKEKLENVLKNVELKVISLISEKNAPIIRQVSDIPRLFRRTNRGIPTQPCSYVSSLLAPIDELKSIHSKYTSHWIPSIISSITSMYYEQVSEVITSVQRTEESLRKFKKIRSPSNLNAKNNTDDDKIRLQLQLDIQHYIDKAKTLTDSSCINKLVELNDILQTLKRN